MDASDGSAGGTSEGTSSSSGVDGSGPLETSDGSGVGSGGSGLAGPCAGFEDRVVRFGDVTVETEADIAALAGVACVTGDLSVSNASVLGLEGLDALVRVEGSLAFSQNQALSALDGLGSLEYVGAGLFFDQNDALVVASLPSLSEIGVVLLVGQTGSEDGPWGNASLVGLNFPQLAVIHGDVVVRHNPLLASLHGLDALETIDGDSDLILNDERVLEIFDNASLPMEDAQAFADRFAFDHVVVCGNGGDPSC